MHVHQRNDQRHCDDEQEHQTVESEERLLPQHQQVGDVEETQQECGFDEIGYHN